MIYQGTVRNGVVVFDAPTSLMEGTAVRIETVAPQAPSPAASHFHPVGEWEGPPGKLDQLVADVQATRDGDVDLERDAWK